MTKEELIGRLQDIEWDDFEVKEAKSALPKNIWETVSAFANTSGGWIVLGIKQNGKVFEIQGVENIEKLEQDFAGAVRSQKFNIRLSFSINNVATISGYSGLSPMLNSQTISNITDPGANTLGVDNKEFYPLSRTYSLGVSVTF